MTPRTPPAEIRARGFLAEVRWSLRRNWMWYAGMAVAFLLLGYWL